jgi:hypothetical protein
LTLLPIGEHEISISKMVCHHFQPGLNAPLISQANLLEKSWGTHWELEEHVENIIGKDQERGEKTKTYPNSTPFSSKPVTRQTMHSHPFLFPCQKSWQDKQCTLTPFPFSLSKPVPIQTMYSHPLAFFLVKTGAKTNNVISPPFLFPYQNPCQDKQCTLTRFPFSLSKPATIQGFWQCTLNSPHPLLTRKKKMSPLGCMFSRLTDYMKTIGITLSSFSAWANTSI